MADTKISADYVANPFTWDGTEILPGIKAGANGAGLVSGLAGYLFGIAAFNTAADARIELKLDGRAWKQPVRAASTANGTLATAFENGDTLDGVTLATGDRILLKNQTTGSENGIYVVAASGAPARASDADTGAELVNATVAVSEGTTNADTQWTCSTNAPITVGSTSLVFVSTGTSTSYSADGSTLQLVGTTFSQKDGGTTNAKLANVSQWTLKGRVSSGSGAPEDLTYNQARQLLNKKQALTDGTTISWDADLGVNARVTLGGNRTLANPTNLVDGDVLNLRIIQDGTGSRTLAYGSKWKFPGGTAPVLSTAAGTVDFLSAQYDSTADTLVAVLNKAFA